MNMSPAYVGMAMTYTLLVPIYLNWLVRNMASLEMYMNSVERVEEFSHLETEDHKVLDINCKSINNFVEKIYDNPFPSEAIPNGWPKRGEIEFIDVSLKYESSAEPVIKSANFHIKPGEKVYPLVYKYI